MTLIKVNYFLKDKVRDATTLSRKSLNKMNAQFKYTHKLKFVSGKLEFL